MSRLRDALTLAEDIHCSFSYALGTINVMASAPAFRRLLVKLNGNSPLRQVYFLDACFIVLCGAITAAVAPGARISEKQCSRMFAIYSDLQSIIQQGKQTNDLTVLAQLAERSGELGV